MSLSALLEATRNLLRSELTNFYDNDDEATQTRDRANNCRVMPDERPVPMCGQEFIAIYGRLHQASERYAMEAIEERYSVTIAVSRKCGVVPRDSRGEASYIHVSDQLVEGNRSLEGRTREIIRILAQNKYQLLRSAEELFPLNLGGEDVTYGYVTPLIWTGGDSQPAQVDATHFTSWHAGIDDDSLLPPAPEADEVYGLLMKLQFDDATRIQPISIIDAA